MEVKFKEFYNELWNLDQGNNGFRVSGRDTDGKWKDINAGILLDEQYEAAGRRKDIAPNPLFFKVDERKLKSENYTSFIDLLNNYIVNPKYKEDKIDNHDVEDIERNIFLDNIMKTRVIERTLEFINETVKTEILEKILSFIDEPVKSELTENDFKKYMEKIWFDIYINRYGREEKLYCSGFEHVFVGEGKGDNNNGIGGYHNWIKFYYDEKNKRVDFSGYNYVKNKKNTSLEKQGANNPYVATIQMTWTPKDIYGRSMKRKFKSQGGFFVGISPECQFAMGTLLQVESLNWENKKKTNRQAEINGHIYDLVIYSETAERGKENEGMRIRSFFPKYLGPKDILYLQKYYKIITNENDIKIIASYLNPTNADRSKGWIEIDNLSSKTLSIDGWKLLDRLKNETILEGNISPNKTRRLMIYEESFSFNKDGVVELKGIDNNTIAKIQYHDVPVGKTLYF